MQDLEWHEHAVNDPTCWCGPSVSFFMPEPGSLTLILHHRGYGVHNCTKQLPTVMLQPTPLYKSEADAKASTFRHVQPSMIVWELTVDPIGV